MEACIGVYRRTVGANIGANIQPHEAWTLCMVDDEVQSGSDSIPPYRCLHGKPFYGSMCVFGELVHWKLQGRPTSRGEPRRAVSPTGKAGAQQLRYQDGTIYAQTSRRQAIQHTIAVQHHRDSLEASESSGVRRCRSRTDVQCATKD